MEKPKKEISLEKLNVVACESNIVGACETDLAYGRGDDIFFLKEDELDDESNLSPEYVYYGTILGIDPKTGKLVVKQKEQENVQVNPDIAMPISALEKIVDPIRGEAIIIWCSYLCKLNKLCYFFMISTLLIQLTALATHNLFLLILSLLLFLKTLKTNKEVQCNKELMQKKLQAYVLFLAIAKKLHVDNAENKRRDSFNFFAKEYLQKGNAYTDIVNTLYYKARIKDIDIKENDLWVHC